MKRNLFDTRKLVIYVGSALLPLLGLIPIAMRYLRIGKWGLAGCLAATVVGVLVMATTLPRGQRGIAAGAIVLIAIILAIIISVSQYVPVPPARFFVCYYVVDTIVIVISIAITYVSTLTDEDSDSGTTAI